MSEFEIAKLRAREILDCRMEPTIEVMVMTEGGCTGSAAVPCGKSTGTNEAFQLRDGGSRYGGKGVRKAVENVDEVIGPQLIGRNVTDQRLIDDSLIDIDGTDDKSELGGNSITGVSLAVSKAAANALGLPLYRYIGGANSHVLPIPLLDVIEGGKLAASDLDFQEHHIVPTGAESFSEAIRMGAEVYYELGDVLSEKYGKHSLNVGVEGGYTPPGLSDPREAFDVMLDVVEELGYEDEFVLGIDAASTHFYDGRTDNYNFMGEEMSRGELIDFYDDLVSTYPLESMEDPLQEEDFEGFRELRDSLSVQIVGDDLFVTNIDRLNKGIENGSANCLLFKVNQVGTLSEALEAAELALRNNYRVQVSERSGQTADTWLADLTVGLNAGQIKTGVSRSERTEQYNRLFEIEKELGSSSGYGRWPTC